MDFEKPKAGPSQEIVPQPDPNSEVNSPANPEANSAQQADATPTNAAQNDSASWLLMGGVVLVGGALWLMWHYWWPILIFAVALSLGIAGLLGKERGFLLILSIGGMIYGFNACSEVRSQLRFEAQTNAVQAQSPPPEEDIFDKIGDWIRHQLEGQVKNQAIKKSQDPPESQPAELETYSFSLSADNAMARATITSDANVSYDKGFTTYELPRGKYTVGCGISTGNPYYLVAGTDIDSRTYTKVEIDLSYNQSYRCDTQSLKEQIGDVDSQGKILFFTLEDVVAKIPPDQLTPTKSGYEFVIDNFKWSVDKDAQTVEVSNVSDDQVFLQNLELEDEPNYIPISKLNEMGCHFSYSTEKRILTLPVADQSIEVYSYTP